MKSTYPFKTTFIAAAVMLIMGVFSFATLALANPFYVGSSARSAAATSTVTYLTPGTGTTTSPLYDSYEQVGTNERVAANYTLPDSVAIVIQGNASSTSSVLNITCEFSDEGIDWYQNEIPIGTTTNPTNIAVPVSFSFAFASSTFGGVSISPTKYQKLVQCPVPLRFVRAVITDTGAGASVWTAIIPKKQRN